MKLVAFHSRQGRSWWRPVVLAGLLAVFPQARAQAPSDLTQATLEDLMNVQVTSVSKKEQKLSKAGAAVFVITQDDIRRSGATNIPDLLRMVPGVDVAQIDASAWAISIRGFNNRYANKVLVLVDGRTVYSPEFSGVFWDQQDVPLADIDRIEVIRGPGGTIWGANAVNGVINIITKSSKATQGGWVEGNVGSQENASGLVQYGGPLGNQGTFRVFAKHLNAGGLAFPDGSPAGDGWHLTHGGFRSDWDLSYRDSLTVEGDLLTSVGSETITTLFSNQLPLQQTMGSQDAVNTGDLLGRWTHSLTNGSELSIQGYYNRDDRSWLGIHDTLNTLDWDVSHHFKAGSRNDIVWGFGYRFTQDHSTPGYAVRLLPLDPTNNLANAFLQDEITLSHSLSLTVGTKVEHNTFTGFEFEPSAQLVWDVRDGQAVWISGGRAIREPARIDRSLDVDLSVTPLPGGTFALLKILGDRKVQAEELRDVEGGYRTRLNDRISLDFDAFLSFYANLATQEPGASYSVMEPGPPHIVIPLVTANMGQGHTYGGEAFANFSASRQWRLSAGYSLLHMILSAPPPSQDQTLAGVSASAPTNQFQIRSFLNPTRRLDWDCTLAYVGALRDTGSGFTPSYVRLDTRLGFRWGESTELSLVGQNLLTPRHLEFHAVYPVNPAEIPRSIYAKITWRF